MPRVRATSPLEALSYALLGDLPLWMALLEHAEHAPEPKRGLIATNLLRKALDGSSCFQTAKTAGRESASAAPKDWHESVSIRTCTAASSSSPSGRTVAAGAICICSWCRLRGSLSTPRSQRIVNLQPCEGDRWRSAAPTRHGPRQEMPTAAQWLGQVNRRKSAKPGYGDGAWAGNSSSPHTDRVRV